MVKKTLTVMLIIFITRICCGKEALPSKPVYEMTRLEIDQLLTDVSQQSLTISERINYYSELFLGMPYKLSCSGDGPYSLYETLPLINFE